jgi:hypothetical protein
VRITYPVPSDARGASAAARARVPHLRVRVTFAPVQPDTGTLCAYWLAALVSALNDSERRSSAEFEVYALRALQATLFVYTGAAIPLRASLVAALHQVHNTAMARMQSGALSVDPMVTAAVLMTLQGLVWLVSGDDAFAEHLRFSHLFVVVQSGLSSAQPHCQRIRGHILLWLTRPGCRWGVCLRARRTASTRAPYSGHSLRCLQASGVQAVVATVAQAGYRHKKDEHYEDDIANLMGAWHLPSMTGQLAPDALVCETGATLKAWLQVRGTGLAASAYGVLQCPQAVDALVARWTAGPWAGRLRWGWDYAVTFRSCDAVPGGRVDEAAAKAARTRFGRAPRAAGEPWAAFVDSPAGLRELRGKLRSLRLHVAGGGRAALCLPFVRLPMDAWISDMPLFLTGREDASEAQVAGARGAVRAAMCAVGPRQGRGHAADAKPLDTVRDRGGVSECRMSNTVCTLLCTLCILGLTCVQ